MRRWIDARMLAFLTLHYALTLGAWTLFPFEPRFALPLAAALAGSAWICAVIAHNVLHCPVFESRRLSSLLQIIVSCAYGFPVSEYLPGHNLSHHRHLQKQADLMRTTKAPFVRLNLLNLAYFAPRVVLDVFRQNRQYARAVAQRQPAWYRQLSYEAVACWGTKLTLFALDWRRCLVFIVVPQLFAVYAIVTVNLIQHDGCDEDHPLNHSRNFVGRFFNWLTFNNGFHGAHHDEPGLHWSLLPEAHSQRYSGRIAPQLEQRSLVRYLLKTYVLTTRRKRFDGTPFSEVRSQPDESWIPRHEETCQREELA